VLILIKINIPFLLQFLMIYVNVFYEFTFHIAYDCFVEILVIFQLIINQSLNDFFMFEKTSIVNGEETSFIWNITFSSMIKKKLDDIKGSMNTSPM